MSSHPGRGLVPDPFSFQRNMMIVYYILAEGVVGKGSASGLELESCLPHGSCGKLPHLLRNGGDVSVVTTKIASQM